MSLFRAPLLPTSRIAVRWASTTAPPTSRVQLSKPSSEMGFFQYARNWSRDPKAARAATPPQKGDLPMTFMLRRLGHAYEVYPLIFLSGAWFLVFCFCSYWSFTKIEVWLDRSQSTAPWSWDRIRDNYWKKNTVIFDLDGRTRKRCELMEMLQDEMLEAAKKRGTR